MSTLTKLRAALAARAEPERAPKMQAYMKSAMPYHGVSLPGVRAVMKELLADVAWPDAAAWERDVRAVWDGARFREERYGAIAMCRHRAAKRFQTPDALPLYEHLVVTGAWWDFVDEVAAHCVGGLLRTHPAPIGKKMRAWSTDENLWKRRVSILCQLTTKTPDLELLYACIEPSLASREFFLRKAIGWALRQLAWTQPDETLRYVRANAARLSPLSKREALKNLLKGGVIDAIP